MSVVVARGYPTWKRPRENVGNSHCTQHRSRRHSLISLCTVHATCSRKQQIQDTLKEKSVTKLQNFRLSLIRKSSTLLTVFCFCL